jgi:hypothetical protein
MTQPPWELRGRGVMDFGADDRQVMPTRRGLPVDTGGSEEWEEELGLTEGIWSGLKKV